MTITGSTGETQPVVEPQMMCEACARMVLSGTEWHSLSVGYLDREKCCHADSGPGYWVCEDCHEIIHEWMERNQDAENPAKEGLQRIFKGLAQIIEDPPRKYQRAAKPDSVEDEPPRSGEDHGPHI